MTVQKNKVEFVSYVFCSILTLAGTGLSLAGLLLPYWYEIKYIKGIVEVKVNIGLWQDRICEGSKDCEYSWIVDYDQDSEVSIPSGDLIKWMETAGTALGFLSLVFLVFMWRNRFSRPSIKILTHVLYFTPCMIAAFLCVVGTLVLSSKGDDDLTDWAPFLSGIGGALLFMSGCLACVVCRYDPTYGTLENPVSPKYISTS